MYYRLLSFPLCFCVVVLLVYWRGIRGSRSSQHSH
uniref:Uncharacterized protein n=1 Tax=Anguilla anguilla TaxID=7936 RepID=A0A0E9T3I9_ANGAN